MLPKALLAAALATSTASAFLLPPPTDVEMERSGGRHHHHKGGKHHGDSTDIEGVETSDVKMVSPFYHEFTKVKVPCPGCSMQIRKHGHHGHGDKKENDEDNNEDGKIITVTDVANHINLFFKIDHQDDGDHLLVNHFELYPNVDINGDGLLATQAPDHFHHKKGKGKHHKEHHHDEEEKKEKHDDEEEKKEKHDDDEEKHDEKHEHDSDGHDEELKKRHRRHRKHDDNDEEEHDGFEGKHWKPKKDFKDVKFHHEGEDKGDKEFRHGKHHKHGKHLVKVPLGYAMQTQAVGQNASNGTEVVALSLEIIQVNGEFVQNIPAVNIRLIRTPEGGLMIARVDLAGDESTPEKEVAALPGKDRMDALKEELDACTNILCRWKAIIASGIKAHRGGCAGKAKSMSTGDDEKEEKPHRHHHHKGHHDEDDSEKSEDKSENKEKKPHHHHKPMREHSWKQLAAKFASHILFPVLMGVALGIFASVVGVAVGTLLVSAWRLLFRRQSATVVRAIQITDDKPTPVAVVVVDRHADEAAVEEEKTGLMAAASTEELPPYQDNDKKGSA